MKDTFLWGASTSAFQVEGAFDEDGRGFALTEIRSFTKKTVHNETVAYNPDLCEISNGTIHRRLYRVLRDGDHIVIPSGRGAGIVVDTANCKSFIIVPHYVNGMTGRSIVRMLANYSNGCLLPCFLRPRSIHARTNRWLATLLQE